MKPLDFPTSDSDSGPSSGDWRLPSRLLGRELERVNLHRSAVDVTEKATTTADTIGLAISGGGVRSAIFALGVLQAMASRAILHRVDYLSTVSGGSYIGAFYGSLFVTDAVRQGGEPNKEMSGAMAKAAESKVAATLNGNQQSLTGVATPLDYLRDNCDYLTPNGTTDLLQSLAFTVRNWFALQYVIGTALIALLLPFAFLAHWLPALTNQRWPQYVSPIVLVPALIAALAISPLSRAYWLTQNKGRQADRRIRNLPFVTLILIFLGGVLLSSKHVAEAGGASHISPTIRLIGWWLQASSVLVFLAYEYVHLGVAWSQTSSGARFLNRLKQVASSGGVARNSRDTFEKVRNQLSNAYTAGLWTFRIGPVQIMLLALLLAIVDSAGSVLAESILNAQWSDMRKVVGSIVAFVGSNGVLISLTKSLAFKSAAPIGRGKPTNAPRPPLFVIASIAAVVVGLLTLVFWSTTAHVAVRLFYPTPQVGLPLLLVTFWAVVLIISVIDGFCFQFLNMSSYHRLYSVRLTRTFLGATNPNRQSRPDRRNLTDLMPGDNITMNAYFASETCAPVHIINATINKTVDWDSSLVQRHARGLPCGIGPICMTVGQRFGTLDWDWTNCDDASTDVAYCEKKGRYSVESLTLGDWVGISGAAVSTGLGQITRPAYSILLGVANVRLGYWWDTRSPSVKDTTPREPIPVAPTELLLDRRPGAPLFGTQRSLLDELFARFDGPRARRWYLTDGGHYENTGAYELIRRGLKFIVVLDNGCDPENHFGDIANLIEHVRVDFGIDIVEADGVAPPPLPPKFAVAQDGTIATSFSQFKRRENCCAVQLIVRYPEDFGGAGNLLVIKPRLIAGVPYDLTQYQQDEQPTFPQETTADQFFDTVQWEAHRALGFHIGSAVFGVEKNSSSHLDEDSDSDIPTRIYEG